MSHTLHIDGRIIAPLREPPTWGPGHGEVQFKVTTLFLEDPAELATGAVAIADDAGEETIPVKCFSYHGDRVVLSVDGCALERPAEGADEDEDHLVLGGEPIARLAWVRRSLDPNGPCVVACPREAWRAVGLRTRRRPRACGRCPLGALLTAPVEPDPAQWIGEGPPVLEVVRLRRRERLALEPFAATFDDAGAQLIGRVTAAAGLGAAPHPSGGRPA